MKSLINKVWLKSGISWTLTVLVAVVLSGPVSGQTNPLDQYLSVAADNNPQLKALFNEYLAALERVPQVGALPDPKVAFNYFVSPVETRLGAQEFSFGASQMFPWFGTLNAREQAASAMAKAKYEAFQDEKNRLFYQVKSTYYQWYVLEKNISITGENLDLYRTYKEMARVKFESGKVGMVDPLRVDMEIEELENRLAYLRDSREPLKARFEELLNKPLNNDILLPDSLALQKLSLDRKAIMDSIIANNPQFRQLDYQYKVFEEQEEVARKSGRPSFSVGLSYINISERTDMELDPNGTDAFMFPQVGVSIPIYRKKYNAQRKEAQFRQEAIRQKTENLGNRLRTSLENGIRDYRDAERRVSMYKRLLILANKSRSLLLTDYTSDGKEFEEVLRMEGKVLDYQLELEKARADLNTSIALINYLMGQ